ncbi:Cubilin [Eumeta japonica]|uniref:Cubilin n=1 Tax=Eumeta variegata TaxID=151549 RepID=A0A4C1SZ61_EUMVA|nr:Cubilin [Eumeta japonica]
MTCGGTITVQNDGLLSNDDMPTHFNGNCSWTIVAKQLDQKISLTITHLSLLGNNSIETNRHCPSSFLRVRDGNDESASLINEFCGHKVPPMIVSRGNTITVELGSYSGPIVGKFSAHYSALSTACGGSLTSEEGSIASPNYPDSYPTTSSCEWIVSTSPGVFCGDDRPLNTTVASQLFIKFRDGEGTGRGFIAHYGFIHVHCEWAVKARPGRTLNVRILDFNITNGNNDCQNHLTLRNGESIESPLLGQGKFCGYSHEDRVSTLKSSSNALYIVYHLVRSQYQAFSLHYEEQGVECGLTSELDSNNPWEVINSPNYPSIPTPFSECEWKFSAPPGEILKIDFIDRFDLARKEDCDDEFVEIRDGASKISPLKGLFCREKPSTVKTSGNYVYIKYVTQLAEPRNGFRANISIDVCGHIRADKGEITSPAVEREAKLREVVSKRGLPLVNQLCVEYHARNYKNNTSLKLLASTTDQLCGDILSNYESVFASPNYPNGYSANQECTWDIIAEKGNRIMLNFIEFLDCHWIVSAPQGKVIQVDFTNFHIAPCRNVNQTALGISKCDCDFVEIRDGINPNSLLIGTYCGHDRPPTLSSSRNLVGIRLSTDGEIGSSGFTISFSIRDSPCGRNNYEVTGNSQIIKSPGYDGGAIPRGLHCSYYLSQQDNPFIHLRINNMDLQNGSLFNVCDKDVLIVTENMHSENTTLGTDLILRSDNNEFFDTNYAYYDILLHAPQQIVLCGIRKSVDIYLTGNSKINLITAPESEKSHRGVEMEISSISGCSRNYTEPQGRIQVTQTESNSEKCSILISVPENITISLYFIYVTMPWDGTSNLQIFDGDTTTATLLTTISESNSDIAVFSTGSKVLIWKNGTYSGWGIGFDMNYYTSDKGRGCGGRLHNIVGNVASPLYPNTYRHVGTCEWELETPAVTRLRLQFKVFDLGASCEQNYVQLVDRGGNVFSTYCAETPAIYTSSDNYVKIVFTTTMNNAGSGWTAQFLGVTL